MTVALTDSVPLAATRPLLGSSAATQEVFRLIERVAPTEASMLLTAACRTSRTSSACR